MLLLVSSSRAIWTRGAWVSGRVAAGTAHGAVVTALADPVASALHAVAATAMSVVDLRHRRSPSARPARGGRLQGQVRRRVTGGNVNAT